MYEVIRSVSQPGGAQRGLTSIDCVHSGGFSHQCPNSSLGSGKYSRKDRNLVDLEQTCINKHGIRPSPQLEPLRCRQSDRRPAGIAAQLTAETKPGNQNSHSPLLPPFSSHVHGKNAHRLPSSTLKCPPLQVLSLQLTCARGNFNLRDSIVQRPRSPHHASWSQRWARRPDELCVSRLSDSETVRPRPWLAAPAISHWPNENIFIGGQHGPSVLYFAVLPSLNCIPSTSLFPLFPLLLPPTRFHVLLSALQAPVNTLSSQRNMLKRAGSSERINFLF